MNKVWRCIIQQQSSASTERIHAHSKYPNKEMQAKLRKVKKKHGNLQLSVPIPMTTAKFFCNTSYAGPFYQNCYGTLLQFRVNNS